jgi:hypothetical protein
MSGKARPCCVTACDKFVPADSEHEKCAGCRARDRHWKRLRPKQWFDYRQRLTKWSSRMDLLIEDSGVSLLQKKRKA